MPKNNLEKPLVSVILPTFKRKERLKEAVESVLGQTYKNIEVLVIDDTPDDSISQIVSGIGDERIKHIKSKERLGFVKSLNKGAELAKGKYIARIDADDFWLDPRKLEKQVDFLEENKEYVLCGGGIVIVDETGKELIRYLHPKKDKDIRNSILLVDNFTHSSVLFNKDAFQKVGGYDENLDFAEDWDLWLKLGKVGKFYNFQEYFVQYLKSPETRSNRKKEMDIGDRLRKKYRLDYPNYCKARIFSLFYSFYYAFLRRFLYPISPILRKLVFKFSKK
jgi:glycosyltransferase involved in cell wall biosynthesis